MARVPPTRLPVVPAQGDPCTERGCSTCCHGTEMVLTEDDLVRLRTFLGGRPDLPQEGWFLADDGYVQLRTAPPAAPGLERPCAFLVDGRCAVYPVRPEGCRLYPAVWDEALRSAVLDDEVCPHTGRFRVLPATAAAVRSLGERLEAERRARMRPGRGPHRPGRDDGP